MAEMLFTDPDGDGQGDWSTDASTPTGDVASRAYVDGVAAGLLTSPQFIGTPTAPTAAPGTNTVQLATTAFVQAAIQTAIPAALLTTPLAFYATGTSYGGRPVTTRPVWWMSWDVAPPATSGTTSSGTGPVVGLDVVFLGVGVVPG